MDPSGMQAGILGTQEPQNTSLPSPSGHTENSGAQSGPLMGAKNLCGWPSTEQEPGRQWAREQMVLIWRLSHFHKSNNTLLLLYTSLMTYML